MKVKELNFDKDLTIRQQERYQGNAPGAQNEPEDITAMRYIINYTSLLQKKLKEVDGGE